MAEQVTSRWEPRTPVLGSVNSVLMAHARRHTVKDFPGPLSIKTVTDGRVAWRVDRRLVWVEDSSFLVLNDGEPYSMDIDSLKPVSIYCVFFKKGFVEGIVRDISTTMERCLDDPHDVGSGVSFLSSLQPMSAGLAGSMANLRRLVVAESTAIEIDECYLNVVSQLLSHFDGNRKQMAKIGAARASTREELYARVSRGREFLHAVAYGPVMLFAAARAAGMSPFHFQRTFAQAFGKTPAQYVAGLRFERAVRLLLGGMPVTDVCLAVGFESLGSFSSAFKRCYGVPPNSLRSQFRKIEEAQESLPDLQKRA